MSDALILLGVIVSGFYYWRTLHWRRLYHKLDTYTTKLESDFLDEVKLHRAELEARQ